MPPPFWPWIEQKRQAQSEKKDFRRTSSIDSPGTHFRAGWRARPFRTSLRLHRKGGGRMQSSDGSSSKRPGEVAAT